MGLTNSLLCRECGIEDETSADILSECEALTSLRHVYLGFFFLDPEDIKCLILGAIGNFRKRTGLPWTDIRLWGPLIKVQVHRDRKVSNPNANEWMNQSKNPFLKRSR